MTDRPIGSPARTGTTTQSPTPPPALEADIEVPPCPEKPDPLTREDVLAFATQFEEASRIRQTIPRNAARVVSVRFEITDSLVERNVTRTDDGWLVRFTVVGPAYRYYPDADSTETVHGDPGMTAANYFVTDQTVLRAHATEAVDPREHGTVVRCPPE